MATAKYPTDEAGIRFRICHSLSIYPNISYTMLQISLGQGFRPVFWRPVLMKMIEKREVLQREEMRLGPTGRYNMYTFLKLSPDLQEEYESQTHVEIIDRKQ